MGAIRATVLFALILVSGSLAGAADLQVKHGRPIVDGVFVNGHGPYRFLVDTGSNVDLIDANLARSIGLRATFHDDLASATGKISVAGSDDNVIVLGAAEGRGQKLLYAPLEAIRAFLSDIQGVLGEAFLSQFDYSLDLRDKRLEFGKQNRNGLRTHFKMVNARPVVSTSLGNLALDSGSVRLVRFGAKSDVDSSFDGELRTVTGAQSVGLAYGQRLFIEGREIWEGVAVALPNRSEPGVDGLMPLGLFKSIYFCNSEGYVVLD